MNDLEHNLHPLIEAKIINLEVTLGSMVKAGVLSGLDPWDVWCGNGWIFRRRWPGPGPRLELDAIRSVIHQELQTHLKSGG